MVKYLSYNARVRKFIPYALLLLLEKKKKSLKVIQKETTIWIIDNMCESNISYYKKIKKQKDCNILVNT